MIRPDSQAQLKLAVDELGFRYVRFHAIFHDVLATVRVVDGRTVYDWSGIDRLYDELAARNPAIVMVSGSVFGQTGPLRDKPAFDDVIQAACGLASLNSIGHDEPCYTPTLVADKTAVFTVTGVTLAGYSYTPAANAESSDSISR